MKSLTFIALFLIGFGSLQVSAQVDAPSTATEQGKKNNQSVSVEVEEKNKNITKNNEQIQQALLEGQKAFEAKDYQLAAKKFDEGYRIDPDFAGSAPVMLNNKAIALRMLGTEKYNAALKANQNPAAAANQYFLGSVNALKEALKILDEAAVPTDEDVKKTYAQARFTSIQLLPESYRLLVLTDQSKIYEAIEAYEQYINIEKDELNRQKAQTALRKLKNQYKIND